jgi:hypothetical protein
LQSINFTRGALRIWIVLTLVWLGLVGVAIWNAASSETIGRYQYTEELRDGINPWEAFDGKKPYAEVFLKPSAAKGAPVFGKVEWQYQGAFDKAVEGGSKKVAKLPDGYTLYIPVSLDASENDILVNAFWDSRWKRQVSALGQQHVLAGIAVVPPLFLLLAWFVGRWVVAGFRKA